jgi:hypothetical protein
MKRLIFSLLLLVAPWPALAACPAGSTCAQYNGTVPYAVTGGNTTRTPATRAVDAWTSFPDVGIDCTGVADSTTALQNAINAMPDFSSLVAPAGCIVYISAKITGSNRRNIQLISLQIPKASQSGPPSFIWHGTGTGPMFDFESDIQPVVRGFYFGLAAGKTINGYVNFDGQGGTYISTAPIVENNFFDGSAQNNANFKAISVSATATSNNENAQITNNAIICSGTNAVLRARDGVTNGTTTLTSATAAFVSGDVGARIRVSYAGGILDTTIASVTNGTTVILTAGASFSQTGVTIHTGQAYGTGFYNGPSGNNKNQILLNNTISQCARGVDNENGSFFINGLGGGLNDVEVYVLQSTETSEIEDNQSEGSLQGLVNGNNSGTIVWRSNRLTTTNALANGYFYFVGGGRFTFLDNNSIVQSAANSVLFGFGNTPTTPILLSVGNNLQPLTIAQINYATVANAVIMADEIGSNQTMDVFLGLPTSASGLVTGQLWNNSGVLTVH